MREHIVNVVRIGNNFGSKSKNDSTIFFYEDKNDDCPSVPLKKQLKMAVQKHMENTLSTAILDPDLDTVVKIEMPLQKRWI